MTEQHKNPIQRSDRIPTYHSFGDPDEASLWVLQRIVKKLQEKNVSRWWNNPHESLQGLSPSQVWEIDPDQIIKLVA